MGFCVNCGTALPQGARFCPKCGKDMGAWLQQYAPAGNVAPQVPVVPVQQPVIPQAPVAPVQQPVIPQAPVAPVQQPVIPQAPVAPVQQPVIPQAPVAPVQQPVIPQAPVAPVQQPVIPQAPVAPVQQPVIPQAPVAPVQQPVIPQAPVAPVQQPVIPQAPVAPVQQPVISQNEAEVAPAEEPVAIETKEAQLVEEATPVKGKGMLSLGKVLGWFGFVGSVFALISSGIFVGLMICLDNIKEYYDLTSEILIVCGEVLVLDILAAVFIGKGEKKNGLQATGCKRLSWVSIVLAAIAAVGAVFVPHGLYL